MVSRMVYIMWPAIGSFVHSLQPCVVDMDNRHARLPAQLFDSFGVTGFLVRSRVKVKLVEFATVCAQCSNNSGVAIEKL